MKREPKVSAERDEVLADLSKRIYEKALERAVFRKQRFREKFFEELRKDYPVLTDDQCLELIRNIAGESISRRFIYAEIQRMNSSITFLANENAGADKTEGVK